MDFREVWTGKKEGIRESFKKGLKPQQRNIRPRLENAIKILNRQVAKLDVSIRNLKEKDRIYFAKVVQAIKEHDRTMATLYANELVEIRKALRALKSAKYAIHSVIVRLKTVQSVGDAAAELLPVMQVIKDVKSMVTNIIPAVDDGLTEVSEMLTDVLWEATQTVEAVPDIATASDEARKIIHEAEKLAKEEMSKELPGIPEPVASAEGEGGYDEFKF